MILQRKPAPARARGFSLIELMVAMMLGLLVVGAAIAIFYANKQTYRTNEGLGRVQENLRTSFELMARDLREAGGNPCSKNVPIANVLNGAASRWYTDLESWGGIVVGYDNAVAFPDGSPAFGTAAGTRVSGTDAVQLLSGGGQVATIEAHSAASSAITLNRTDAGYSAGDLLIACNPYQATVFQASGASGDQVLHAASGSPGNCDATAGASGCGLSGLKASVYNTPSSVLVNLNAARWYVGHNSSGGNSLYKSALQNASGTPTVVNQEVLDGVQDMQVTYLVSGATSYVAASAVTDWSTVTAVRIVLTLASTDKVGTGGNAITRQLIQTVSLRNRNA